MIVASYTAGSVPVQEVIGGVESWHFRFDGCCDELKVGDAPLHSRLV